MKNTGFIQIKLDSEEKDSWQKLAKENGFLSAPTMIRYLVVQYGKKQNTKYSSGLEENLALVQRIREGKEELFSGDLHEL